MTTPSSTKKYWAIAGLLTALLLLLVLTSCDKAAEVIFEARCSSSLPPANVEVSILPIEFTLDHTLTVSELTRQFPPAYSGAVLGITQANLTKDLSFDNAGMVQPGTGRLCSRPQVKVVLSFTPMKVLVASNFPVGSCTYNEVYVHEMRHVSAYEEFLPAAAAEVQKQLAEALGTQVHYFKDAADAKSTMDTLLNSMWMPYLTEKMAQVELAQDNIDTLEEYERLSHACSR